MDLIPPTLYIKFHWVKLSCLFKSLCRPTPKKTSMFEYPLQNLEQIDCLFNRFFWDNENEIQTLAGIGLSPLTKDPRCKNVIGCNSTDCLRACAGQHQRKHQCLSIPSKNTAFIVNLKQIGCLFNRFFQLTKMKSRLWLELVWVPWQKTLDVKMSLDATKLIV